MAKITVGADGALTKVETTMVDTVVTAATLPLAFFSADEEYIDKKDAALGTLGWCALTAFGLSRRPSANPFL